MRKRRRRRRRRRRKRDVRWIVSLLVKRHDCLFPIKKREVDNSFVSILGGKRRRINLL